MRYPTLVTDNGSGQAPLAFPDDRVCRGATDPCVTVRVIALNAAVLSDATSPVKVAFTDARPGVFPLPHGERLVPILVGDDAVTMILDGEPIHDVVHSRTFHRALVDEIV